MGRSTIPPEPNLHRARRSRTVRRLYIAVLCLFLLAGLLGFLGVRTATTRAAGGGYELEVRYARIARAGLSVPWAVTIRHPGGFDGPVTLTTNSSYFDLFDENAFEPEPESVTTDGELVFWQFTPPEQGDTMEVSLDTRVGPNVQWGKTGRTAIVQDGRAVVGVEYETWVLP